MTNIGINVIDCKLNEQKCSVEELINMVNEKIENNNSV